MNIIHAVTGTLRPEHSFIHVATCDQAECAIAALFLQSNTQTTAPNLMVNDADNTLGLTEHTQT